MPNLSGLPALDVAIGLAFMFFLLSTICSAINESIANVLGWRAKTLEQAIQNVLQDPRKRKAGWNWLTDAARGASGRLPKHRGEPVDKDKEDQGDMTPEVFGHWRVSSLVQNEESSWRRRARPSYLPARAFSLAVAETLAKEPPSENKEELSPWEEVDDEILTRLKTNVEKLPSDARPLLKKALANADENLEKFRTNVEIGFDDAMERASGWYKRKVNIAIALLALAVSVGLNVDTVQVGTRLWKDAPLRESVAAQASTASEQGSDGASGTTGEQTPAQRAAKDVAAVKELNLPIGWGDGNDPDKLSDAPKHIPGWLLTVAALTLGAPFWFDLLSRVARLRGAGVPEKPRSLTDAAGTTDLGVTGIR